MSQYKKRVCVISLDGVPGELLRRAFSEGRLGPLQEIWEQGKEVEISSTFPPISSVAWATYSTGTNPGRHGIYGFVDRDPSTMRQYILSSRDVAEERLWDLLGKRGERSVLINLPLTYPVSPLPGWLVAGFPAAELGQAAWPPELADRLAQEEYLVDPDPGSARNPPKFFAQIERSLAGKRKLALELAGEEWRFFHLHVMATDRVNHFFLRDGLVGGDWAEDFWRVYEEAAGIVRDVAASLPADTELVLMSDHGFAPVDWEVDLNAFLREQGLLRLATSGRGPERVAPGSVAYSLTPGRIYLLRRGRELGGWLDPEAAARELSRLREALLSLRTPDGKPAFEGVFTGAELYHGPWAGLGPDLLAVAAPGVELRSGWEDGPLFKPASRQGGHTLHGAFLWVRGHELKPGSMLDVPATIWALLGGSAEPQLEGQVLLQ